MKESSNKNTMLLARCKGGDTLARDKLCEENMGLVWKVAAKFVRQGVEIEDIVQTGAVGLLKAIDNFNPEFDV